MICQCPLEAGAYEKPSTTSETPNPSPTDAFTRATTGYDHQSLGRKKAEKSPGVELAEPIPGRIDSAYPDPLRALLVPEQAPLKMMSGS